MYKYTIHIFVYLYSRVCIIYILENILICTQCHACFAIYICIYIRARIHKSSQRVVRLWRRDLGRGGGRVQRNSTNTHDHALCVCA